MHLIFQLIFPHWLAVTSSALYTGMKYPIKQPFMLHVTSMSSFCQWTEKCFFIHTYINFYGKHFVLQALVGYFGKSGRFRSTSPTSFTCWARSHACLRWPFTVPPHSQENSGTIISNQTPIKQSAYSCHCIRVCRALESSLNRPHRHSAPSLFCCVFYGHWCNITGECPADTEEQRNRGAPFTSSL